MKTEFTALNVKIDPKLTCLIPISVHFTEDDTAARASVTFFCIGESELTKPFFDNFYTTFDFPHVSMGRSTVSVARVAFGGGHYIAEYILTEKPQ